MATDQAHYSGAYPTTDIEATLAALRRARRRAERIALATGTCIIEAVDGNQFAYHRDRRWRPAHGKMSPAGSSTDEFGRDCLARSLLPLLEVGLQTLDSVTHPFPRPFFARARPGFFSCFAVVPNAASIARGFASCKAW